MRVAARKYFCRTALKATHTGGFCLRQSAPPKTEFQYWLRAPISTVYMEIKEEVKAVEPTTESSAPVVEPNEHPVETSQPSTPEPVLDYAALYEEEKKKLEKAEYTLYRKNKEERLKKLQVEETGIVDPEEVKKIVSDEVEALVAAQRQKDSEDLIVEELNNLTSDPDEQRLIRLKYENALNKTGFSRLAIRQDLSDAQFLANKSKYLKEKSELKQTVIAKKAVINSGVGTNLEKPSAPDDLEKHFSSYDWQWMKKRKWTDAQIKQALAAKSS